MPINRHSVGLTVLNATLLVAYSLTGQPLSAEEVPPGGLCTQEQMQLEQQRMKLMDHPIIQATRKSVREIYEKSPLANTRAGVETLDAALDAHIAAMLNHAVNFDSAKPRALWAANAAHEWNHTHISNSGYGIENPDNVYRHIPLDSQSTYLLKGRWHKGYEPAQQTFTFYSSLPGMKSMNVEGSPLAAAFANPTLTENGEFEVTIDKGHITGSNLDIKPHSPIALLIVRDTIADWSNQYATELSIERISDSTERTLDTDHKQAIEAAEYITKSVPFWYEYNEQFIYSRPVNTIYPPRERGTGWGFSTSGHFQIPRKHSLVVTLNRFEAAYLGFQLTDPWGVASEYVTATGSLNHNQAKHNADGSITYVISATDPGVHNWLDTGGLDRGLFAIRWQGANAKAVDVNAAVLEVRMVPLEDLLSELGTNAYPTSPEERRLQIQKRAQNYAIRLCGHG